MRLKLEVKRRDLINMSLEKLVVDDSELGGNLYEISEQLGSELRAFVDVGRMLLALLEKHEDRSEWEILGVLQNILVRVHSAERNTGILYQRLPRLLLENRPEILAGSTVLAEEKHCLVLIVVENQPFKILRDYFLAVDPVRRGLLTLEIFKRFVSRFDLRDSLFVISVN